MLYMEKEFKYMEKSFRYYFDVERQFNSILRVVFAGILTEKNYHVHHHPKYPGFSFIYRGQGRCRFGDREYIIKAPCVLYEPHGVFIEYGPEPGSTWDEIFFCFQKSTVGYLKWKGYIGAPDKFACWKFDNYSAVLYLINNFRSMLKRDQKYFNIDRFDLLCGQLLTESLIKAENPDTSLGGNIIMKICAEITQNCGCSQNLDYYAEQFGLSNSTLRRYWHRYVGESFRDYCSKVFLDNACHMLANSNMPVKDIAQKLNIRDQLYFSKKFKNKTGLSPARYRQQSKKTGFPA